ncbi:MAG: DUF3488 and transglutaminase-like domain-containing protein, partial [Myxococcota bacterium]|nr:DUF3488 and transglutaminase-like domain-containing protein [Myxococcota bacterium]
MRERLLRSLPLLVACIALAASSRQPAPPLLTAAFAALSVLVPLRLPIDRATQRLAMTVVLVLTIAGLRASGMPMRGPHLGAFGYGLALAPLLMTALRLWTRAAEGGSRVDVSLCLLSLLATGGARPGLAYLAFMAAFLALAVALQRSTHGVRLPFAELSLRTRRIAGLLLVTAVAAGAAAASFAHVAYTLIHRRLGHAMETSFEDQVGLSDNFRLGKVTELLQSDAVVLRVSGPEVDRLRGVVLDEYGRGRWTRAKTEALTAVEVPRVRPAGGGVVEVRHLHPDRDYLFLPLAARDVATREGEIRKDSMGVAHSVASDLEPIVWFRLGERDSMPVVAARVEDLLMPRRLRAPLTAIARAWTSGTHTPEEALAALQSRLRREETYSLEQEADPVLDPVLDFLTISHKGSCEYFATALALLARAVGIPTRLVLGYRVGERNPYFSHYVVRRRNAHAWVEAYLPDGSWTTVDPTPMTELPQDLPYDERGLSAALEATAVGWEYTEAWLAKRTVFELGGAALLGVAVFALQRWMRTRKGAAPKKRDGLEFDPPTSAFVLLEAELGRRGRGRALGETVEGWAARLGDARLRAVLLRYVGARYGTREPAGVDAALEEAAREVHS